MRSPTRAGVRRAAGALLFAVAAWSRVSSAQAFAVGGGAGFVNDTGSVAKVGSFDHWSGHVFGELALERNVLLQVRGSRFTVPGTASDAPNIRVNSATATVGYVFREEWFAAGLFGGLGAYLFRPIAPEGRFETVVDRDENAFGWTGGVVAIFDLGQHWDARMEASGHIIRTATQHKPILIGLSVAYHF